MVETLQLLTGSESVLMPTGYAIVMRNIIPRLVKRGWDIYHMAWQHMGMPQQYGDEDGNQYVQVASGSTSMLHPDFPANMPRYIKEYKVDVAFTLIDFWFTDTMIKYTNQAGLPYINYFPVDGEPFNLGWLEYVKRCHTIMAMSKYGKRVITDCVRDFGRGGWKKHFELDYIYHGIDQKVFAPLKKDLHDSNREKMFKTNPDMFTIGVVGKNCFRKQHPRVIEAFAKFAKGKDDVILLMKVGDPANKTQQGNDLYEYVRQMGLDKGQVLFLDKTDDLVGGIDVTQLAAFYDLFDVYASSTSGEGFGIPTVEAMACGTPCIMTDYTTSKELVKGHGWLVPCNDYIVGEWNIKRGLADIDLMAAAFQDAYDHPAKVRKLGKKAHRFSKKFSWDSIADQFDVALRKAVDEGAVPTRDE